MDQASCYQMVVGVACTLDRTVYVLLAMLPQITSTYLNRMGLSADEVREKGVGPAS